MKRLLLLCTLISVMSSVFAQEVSYEGNLLKFKGSGTYDIEFVYDSLLVEGMPMEEYLASKDEEYRNDWNTDVLVYVGEFCKEIPNAVNKKFTLNTINPEYKFVFKSKSLSIGTMGQVFNPFTSVREGGAVIGGEIDFIEVSTNTTLAVINFSEIQGPAGFTDKLRWCAAYVDLSKRIKKILKKVK